jgi:AmmeMemoRadiSam system protein A
MNTEDALGSTLLLLARAAIATRLGGSGVAGEAALAGADLPRLHEPGAVFVTLTRDGHLRGCIGSLEAWRPLIDDVRDNAVAAALRDARFAPLSAAELPRTRVEVSLLGPSLPLVFRDEADALTQLRPGRDGVILSCSGRRATFLPQVWDELPDRREFLAQLKRKAGLSGSFWSESLALARYEVKKWREQ